MIAKLRRRGRTSRKSSTRLPARSGAWTDRPVTLPPGRAKLATKPLATGSLPIANTMGITDVACLTAGTAVPTVTMTLTFSSTNSAAIAAKRSLSAQRYSIATVRPLIQPSSPSRCSKAATSLLHTEGVPEAKNPTLGILAGCCAVATSGRTAAATPSRVTNCRLLIGEPSLHAHTLPRCCLKALCITLQQN